MNPVPLFLIIVTLPLLLGGCGERPVAEVKSEKPPRLEHQINGDEITITKAFNLSGTFTIPSLIEGKQVTSIGDAAFSHCQALTSITIPDSVKTIGKRAFSWCRKLRSIKIPKGITRIEESTFSNSGISMIVIPDSVTSLGYRAFNGCKNLTKITIPSSIASIGDFAFYHCGDLVLNFEGNCPKIEGDLLDLFFFTDPDLIKIFKEAEELQYSHGWKRTNPTVFRQPNATGWSDEWVGAPVKLINKNP